MKQKHTYLLILLLALFSFSSQAQNIHCEVSVHNFFLKDEGRNRLVPIVIYENENTTDTVTKSPVAIINHGYGVTNTAYSYIANHLVKKGFVVIGIQHDLPGDPPMATSGDLFKLRKPVWEEGVKNMLFTLESLKKFGNNWNFEKLLIIGHSNGGDMAMLMASEHPEMIWKVISLDNRRMPIPRVKQPQILSFRSIDMPADPGVLPTDKEQKDLGIQIISLKNTKHNDMWDGGTKEQKQEIISYIDFFCLQAKTH
ncbi:hypothetical protein NF867_17605 [Solitalea sp. MAHUQ-68]|uniref:Alpha/beta hydrolase n=1 Tax=Solitalea agri TaxID=2953739 RepID=A0A9X2JDP2_9SPHI|nr:hypothetical protein [Solitalea agri]MCO4294682.1 hypothetical protein [Solitalea agri]